MGNVFYIRFNQSSRTIRYSCHIPGVSMVSGTSLDQDVEFLRRHCPPRTLATCWELLFAIFTSLICSSYALRHEERNPLPKDAGLQIQLPAVGNGHFEWILDPPPAAMLFACLVLGCAISSFAYRRQERDRYQTPIFILAITAGTIFGLAMGVSANVIMLGVIPWALCLAMIGSVAVHWVVRRCSRDVGVYAEIRCCEIAETTTEKEGLPTPGDSPC